MEKARANWFVIYAYLDDGQWAVDDGDHRIMFTNIIFRNGNNWAESADGPWETGTGGAISIRSIGSCSRPQHAVPAAPTPIAW